MSLADTEEDIKRKKINLTKLTSSLEARLKSYTSEYYKAEMGRF
jgi:hypothetical protein